MIFRKSNLSEIRGAVASAFCEKTPRSPKLYHETIENDRCLQDSRDAVAGGERCLRFLQMRPDEDSQLWQQRQDAFQNIGVCGIIVDQQSHFCYGNPPKRRLIIRGTDPEDTKNKLLQETFDLSYQENSADLLYRTEVAPAVFTDRWTWLKTWYQDATQMIRITQLDRECVMLIPDPRDPKKTFLGVVEVQELGEEWEAWLWTTTEVQRINMNWEPIGPATPNRLGRVPYTMYGSINERKPHPLADAVLDQKAHINMRSWEMAGWRLQAFAILALIGKLISDDQNSSVDGKPRTRVGMGHYLQLAVGSKLEAVNPQFAVREIRDAESSLLRETLERAKISSTTIDSSGTPEQPMAMAMKHMKPMEDRALNITMFREQERQTITDWLTCARAKGLISIDPADVEIKIEFPTEILPTDIAQTRTLDQKDVAEFRMKGVDYILKHVKPDATPEQAQKYWDELLEAGDKANNGLMDGLRSAVNGNVPPPPPAQSRAAEIYGTDHPALQPMPASGGEKSPAMGGHFDIGSRVEVKPGMAHDEETSTIPGTVKIVGSKALGVAFDGMPEIHKWYVAEELEPVPPESTGAASPPGA